MKFKLIELIFICFIKNVESSSTIQSSIKRGTKMNKYVTEIKKKSKQRLML